MSDKPEKPEKKEENGDFSKPEGPVMPPSPEEMQEQLKDFFKDKFGGQVFSFSFPQPGGGETAALGEEPDEDDGKGGGVSEGGVKPRELDFDMIPVQVKDHLDSYVIGQEDAKKILSVAVCDHYNHVREVLKNTGGEQKEYVKQNVILIGPTGVGKTYLVRTLAQLIGVPFVKADITKFSETGYVGGDVDDLVRDLVRMADGDVELAECGIIFLDEIDKIATTSEPVGRDVSGRGVQTGLLKLLEETDVPARSPFDMAAQMREMMSVSRGGKKKKSTINTKNILFVVSGAFTHLSAIVEKRLSASKVGFNAPSAGENKEEDLLKKAVTRDFIEYGFEPEFIGRMPVRVALNELTEDDLFDILKHSEGSLIGQYRRNFEAYGITAAFPDDGLRAIAKLAIKENTGARGLMTVLEAGLREFKFYLPGGPVKRFAVTGEVIEDPVAMLDKIKSEPDYGRRRFFEARVREYEAGFFKEFGIKVILDGAAVDKAVSNAMEDDMDVIDYLEKVLMDYVYGLRIIRDHTGKNEFEIGAENIENPRDVLDAWVKDALKKE